MTLECGRACDREGLVVKVRVSAIALPTDLGALSVSLIPDPSPLGRREWWSR